MNYLLKISLFILLLLFSGVIISQSSEGHVTLLKKNGLSQLTANQINLGIGMLVPDGKLKGYAAQNNALNFNFDMNQVLYSKNKFAIGLNYGLNFNTVLGKQEHQFPTSSFPIINSTSSSLTREDLGSGPAKSWGFKAGIGPQFAFQLGRKWNLGIIGSFGYTYTSNDSTKITQNSVGSYNGKDFKLNKVIYSVYNTEKSFFFIQPKVRLQYQISDRINYWIEPSYSFGGKVTSIINELQPEGVNNPSKGGYNYNQIEAGTYKQTIKTIENNAFLFNTGISINLGKKNPNQTNETTSIDTTKNNNIEFGCKINKMQGDTSYFKCNSNGSISVNCEVSWTAPHSGAYVNVGLYIGNTLVPILSNITTLTSTSPSGIQNISFLLPSSYNDSTFCLRSWMSKLPSGLNEIRKCVPDNICFKVHCKICEKCDGVSLTQNFNSLNSFLIVNGSITLTPAKTVSKVEMNLDNLSASKLNPSLPTSPITNFEFFKSGSTINGMPILIPFSLTGTRSNFISSSNINTSISNIPFNLKIDNFLNLSLKSIMIKVVIYFTDGSYCVRYIRASST